MRSLSSYASYSIFFFFLQFYFGNTERDIKAKEEEKEEKIIRSQKYDWHEQTPNCPQTPDKSL